MKDTHSDESVPFTTVRFLHTGFVEICNSAGGFPFLLSKWPGDPLRVSYTGFEDARLALDISHLDWKAAPRPLRDIGYKPLSLHGSFRLGF